MKLDSTTALEWVHKDNDEVSAIETFEKHLTYDQLNELCTEQTKVNSLLRIKGIYAHEVQ